MKEKYYRTSNMSRCYQVVIMSQTSQEGYSFSENIVHNRDDSDRDRGYFFPIVLIVTNSENIHVLQTF